MVRFRPVTRRLCLVALLVALANAPVTAKTAAENAPAIKPPPPNAGYDSQLGGSYQPDPAIGVVSRDRMERPAKGLYSICYINGYQTQAEELGWWKTHHPDLLLRTADGKLVEDAAWPGEMLLDTSTSAKRAAIIAIVGPWIDQCAKDGFQAIEGDNLDSWTRSGGRLTLGDNVAMARLLVERAHAVGLAAAQRNASELGEIGKLLAGFDFAIVESCQAYDECDRYAAVYGDDFIEIEYPDADHDHFAAACEARGDRISIVLRDRNLQGPESADYVFKAC